VKTLRVASGTPASKLAKLAGISASLLSRVERGLVSPSVETLDRIAEGLRVPVSRLLSDQGRRMDFCHVPAGRGLTVDRIGADSDHRYELLGHLLSGNLFAEPYLVTLLPDAQPCVTLQHPGLKFLYFLSGRIAYRYGSKTVSVGAGDSLLFDAASLHGIEAVDSGPVSYLSVLLALRD
jgi:transcriptional regulator with XRE-family HTH domain